MNISIRKHILSNFKEVSRKEIEETIMESIGDKEELTLPGFGVFFELLWKEADKEMKDAILLNLEKAINKESN